MTGTSPVLGHARLIQRVRVEGEPGLHTLVSTQERCGVNECRVDPQIRILTQDSIGRIVRTEMLYACLVEELPVNFGQAATAVSSDNLVDGVDLGAGVGVFSSIDDGGTNGRTYRRLEVDELVTGSTATGAAAGLAGNAFVFYRAA